MKVDNALILKLENLAKLRLSREEADQLKLELDKIIDMFSQIQEVNTEGIEPLIYLSNAVNNLREDNVKQNLEIEDVSQNAPHLINNLFVVPKVI